ncbi:MAG: hypothetical protein V3T49_03235 [Dehalococcoidia bacterium]
MHLRLFGAGAANHYADGPPADGAHPDHKFHLHETYVLTHNAMVG